jgi:predicted DNA-binding protein YlxM (UPF0122 family)
MKRYEILLDNYETKILVYSSENIDDIRNKLKEQAVRKISNAVVIDNVTGKKYNSNQVVYFNQPIG